METPTGQTDPTDPPNPPEQEERSGEYASSRAEAVPLAQAQSRPPVAVQPEGEPEVQAESQVESPVLVETPVAPAEASVEGWPVTDDAPRLSRRRLLYSAASAAITFTWGIGAGYWLWGRTPASAAAPVATVVVTATPTPTPPPLQLNLPHSYPLPIAYSQIGPQLIEAGAFALDAFVQVYAQAGQPLSEAQQAILREGSDEKVVIDHANAYFLLNLLWAFGLTNDNPLLLEGPLVTYSEGKVERFASTGGWSLAAKPIPELVASTALVSLSTEQQARVEEAAAAIYRPCCNNPTSFPDCNHGMAMLGLLELMAAQDSDVETMLTTAKMVNSFWFPGQSRELALFYRVQADQDFADVPAREAVGAERFSGQGFGAVHQWLLANGQLEAPKQEGGSCGV